MIHYTYSAILPLDFKFLEGRDYVYHILYYLNDLVFYSEQALIHVAVDRLCSSHLSTFIYCWQCDSRRVNKNISFHSDPSQLCSPHSAYSINLIIMAFWHLKSVFPDG